MQRRIVVDRWMEGFNERDERNHTHINAEKCCDADWIFSIDSDEIIEDRISQEMFQQCLKHPDPLVRYQHTGWVNHWESMTLVRVDEPFTAGLRSGMSGCRLWKVNKAAPIRIVGGTDNGLHCGNSPEHSSTTRRVTPIRFRHLSYVRAIDRAAKFSFYSKIDEEKNPLMVGNSGSYSHLVKQENVKVSIYNPNNGLCAFMLCYEEESPVGIGNWLDLFTVADQKGSGLDW